jgi:hypothetical protein
VFLMMYVSAMVENKIKAKFNEIIYSAKWKEKKKKEEKVEAESYKRRKVCVRSVFQCLYVCGNEKDQRSWVMLFKVKEWCTCWMHTCVLVLWCFSCSTSFDS